MTSLRVYDMGDFEKSFDKAQDKFYNKALRFLSYRPRSEKEVQDNLLRKKASKEIIEKVIAKLKEQKFINDEEFVRWWIEQRSTFRTKSIKFIKMELQQKGIDKNIIDRIIQNSLQVGGQAEFIIQNDLERAKKLIEERVERLRGLSKQEVYQKLGSYLSRRGFGWETIKKSIDEILSERV